MPALYKKEALPRYQKEAQGQKVSQKILVQFSACKCDALSTNTGDIFNGLLNIYAPAGEMSSHEDL